LGGGIGATFAAKDQPFIEEEGTQGELGPLQLCHPLQQPQGRCAFVIRTNLQGAISSEVDSACRTASANENVIAASGKDVSW
jgi:hypothetical protein